MSAEGSKYHWASSSTYWLSGRGESFGTRQLEKTTRPSGWIGSAKLPFPHYRPHSADLSQVWADVVEVVGDAYYLATEGSWVVPLSRSDGKTILSVCWKIKRMSSLSLNSWEEQHVRRIDRKPESSFLPVCLSDEFSSWAHFLMAFSFALSGTRRGRYCHLLCIQEWNTNSCDMDLRRIRQVQGKNILTVAHYICSNKKHQMLLQFVFFWGGYWNLFTTPGRLMRIKCHLWGHAVVAGHFVVFT